jgi:hypothetical protein
MSVSLLPPQQEVAQLYFLASFYLKSSWYYHQYIWPPNNLTVTDCSVNFIRILPLKYNLTQTVIHPTWVQEVTVMKFGQAIYYLDQGVHCFQHPSRHLSGWYLNSGHSHFHILSFSAIHTDFLQHSLTTNCIQLFVTPHLFFSIAYEHQYHLGGLWGENTPRWVLKLWNIC